MRFRSASLLAAATILAIPAFADPPSHAPAHGWRKKNDPYYVGYTGRQWEADYGVIEGNCNRAAIGTVLGGVVGAAVGSQIGDGSGRKVAIVLGTVIGAVIGREIGRDLDEADRACVGHALELAPQGRSVRWKNERTGVSYLLVPVASKEKYGNCRSYDLQLSLGGKSQKQRGRACRSGDGTWQITA